MAEQIQLRRGTAALWTASNTLLGQGEPGYETDTGKLKIGDGVTTWGSLPYYGIGETGETGPAGIGGTAVLDFGAFPGSNTASVVVSSPSIESTSIPNAYLAAVATSDHTVTDHIYAALFIHLVAEAPIEDSGFQVDAVCKDAMIGTFNINWNWV
jgi:hypothetical protein